jgi:hypothetical protein
MTFSAHNNPEVHALSTKAWRSVTGADGAAAQMAIGTSAVMTAVNPGRSVVAALGRANDERPPQVEHTQTEETIEDEGGATTVRKTQQTRVETEGGASVTLQRGVEEGQDQAGTPYVRTEQEMRLEDGTGGSVQARNSVEMSGEFYTFMRKWAQDQMKSQTQMVTTLFDGLQQQRNIDKRERQEEMAALYQQQRDDMAGVKTQMESMKEQTQEQISTLAQSMQARMEAIERQAQQQSAGAPSKAQGGPAPRAGQVLKKRGRPPKSASAGVAGASQKKSALATQAKKARIDSCTVNKVQSYPDEERKKDAEFLLYFEPWDRNLKYNEKRDLWQVTFYNKKRSIFNKAISSNYFKFDGVCELRRELCMPIKYRDQNMQTVWSALKDYAPPKRMLERAQREFKIRNTCV